MSALLCRVCDQPLAFTWTDTHGIAVCVTCGLPYRIYHYEDDQRVEKPPACTIKDAWLPLAREYWAETSMRVFPGCHDIGIERGGRTYSGASREEVEAFDAWMARQKDRWPVTAAEAEQAVQS